MLILMIQTVIYAQTLSENNKLKKATALELNDILNTGTQKKVNDIVYFTKN